MEKILNTVPAPINGAPSIQEKTFWQDHAPSNRERLQYQKKFFEKNQAFKQRMRDAIIIMSPAS